MSGYCLKCKKKISFEGNEKDKFLKGKCPQCGANMSVYAKKSKHSSDQKENIAPQRADLSSFPTVYQLDEWDFNSSNSGRRTIGF